MFAGPARSIALLGLAVVCSAFSQQPFSVGAGNLESYDAGLFSPTEDLNVLSTSEFTTLGHPAFPNYNVRIKKSEFCDGSVR
jgi:hypothetical protein